LARFKTIWGPSKEEVERHRICWTFACMWENGSVRGYKLRFYFNTRKFSVKPLQGQANRHAERMAEKDLLSLPEVQRNETISGKTVTGILKARLGDERLARAIALAIQHRRP
jgi:hypothetical protein